MIVSARKHVIALAAAALVAVAVSACGGGGGSTTTPPPPPPPPPMPTHVDVDLSDLMSGYMATAGTITIEAGEHVDHGDIRFQCAAGGEDCNVVVMVTDNGAITAEALATGGTVTAVDVPDMYVDVPLSGLKSDFDAAAGRIEIEAGADEDHGDIRFSCASGPDDCVVMVTVADDGAITAGALATGGMVTAKDRPPDYVNVTLSGLKSGFDAVAGRLEIDAGADEDYGDIRFSCAAGGDDCVVMVMVADDGRITAEALATGGTVTAGDATVDVDLSSLKPGYDADAVTLKIDAGADVDHGDIRFACAAGGENCLVMVMVAGDGTITAWARPSGGTVTAGDATVDVDLSGLKPGYQAEADTLEIDAGANVDHGYIRFACAADGEDCLVMVMVAGDGTITAWARPSGGTVTASDATVDVDLNGVTVGFQAEAIMMLDIAQGTSADHGEIRFSCAAGDYNCRVMVMVADDGTITATSIGGEVTASDASDPNTKRDQALQLAITPPPSPPHSTYAPILEDDGVPQAGYGYEMTGAVVAAIEGWTSSVHELETPEVTGVSPAMTDTLVIYSNTPYEMGVPFTDVHTLDTNMVGRDYQSLIVNNGNLSQVSDVRDFPSTPNLSNANVAMNVGVSPTGYAGKFDGADGEYWCNTVGGCDFSTDADGNLDMLLSGDLYFTPNADETVQHPDPDYMYFGYWINETDDDGDPVFEISGLYGGVEYPTYVDVGMLEGSATYAGAATGLYVRRWTDANNDVLRRRTGQFTAVVALSANFGGMDIAMAQHHSISGTISNFMDGNREIDSSWSLQLGRANFASDGSGYTIFAGTTQDVDGNGMTGTADEGDWSGRLLGEVDTLAPSDPKSHPSGVAGRFDGHFNNGDVIGAYGAKRQE